ncbi:hypothetical protein OM297_21165 [Escherichia albertii]|nr:hypothetical protein [Escherichia albertii]
MGSLVISIFNCFHSKDLDKDEEFQKSSLFQKTANMFTVIPPRCWIKNCRRV